MLKFSSLSKFHTWQVFQYTKKEVPTQKYTAMVISTFILYVERLHNDISNLNTKLRLCGIRTHLDSSRKSNSLKSIL